MGQIADEVNLVRFNQEVVRVPYDMPFVEYQVFNNSPRVFDRYQKDLYLQEAEVYRAKVTVFRYSTPAYSTDTRIALDQSSQNIVDMFVQEETRRLSEVVEYYKRALNLEKSKTCTTRFIEWLASIRFGRLFNG